MFAVVACTETPVEAPNDAVEQARPGPQLSAAAGRQYLLLMQGNALPTDLAAQVTKAGGSIVSTFPALGLAVVSGDAADLGTTLGRINGVRSATLDAMTQWTREPAADTPSLDADAVVFPANDGFYPLQWAPTAVHAEGAWARGWDGTGVRVAILDGGIWDTHRDLLGQIDIAHSTSFVPGQAWNTDVGTFWHATHVAGIVAALDNNIGTVGIAPRATLIGVKVLHNGSGSFAAIISGIAYAATPISEGGAGADIINMSLGASFDRQGKDAAELAVALGRATTYAYQRGVTVVASAGNDAFDLDHTNNLITLPAMSPHVIAVSATSPRDWGHGSTNLDVPTTYTNFGQSVIAFAGPGGDFVVPPAACPTPIGAVNCQALDGVLAPVRGSGTSVTTYSWAAGTSMAAPAVAAVAALAIQRFGHLPPSQIEGILRRSADDLGKPGNDDFYGAGRVNADRATH
jgi:subtilisin family serine protease